MSEQRYLRRRTKWRPVPGPSICFKVSLYLRTRTAFPQGNPEISRMQFDCHLWSRCNYLQSLLFINPQASNLDLDESSHKLTPVKMKRHSRHCDNRPHHRPPRLPLLQRTAADQVWLCSFLRDGYRQCIPIGNRWCFCVHKRTHRKL